jgi:GTPase SAR1 family protein
MGCESSKSSSAKKNSTSGLKVVKPASDPKSDTSSLAAGKLPNSFKVVVVGDVDTGKTSLLMRYATGTFSNEMSSDSVRGWIRVLPFSCVNIIFSL